MNYLLLIKSSPTSAAALNAYRFAEALIQCGHQIERLFFYGDGVLTANCLNCPAQDEFHLYEAWEALICTNKLSAIVCIASAIRRGLLDEEEAARYRKPCANLQRPFVLGGLGELVEGSSKADRLLTFH